MKPSPSALESECAAFNRNIKVGDAVDYYSHPSAVPQRFATRTEASILSGHTAVVWLEGKSGCVACRAVKSISSLVEGDKREGV